MAANGTDIDRASYLNLIQGVVSRMGGNSAIMKGGAVTTIAALYGMCVAECVKWYYLFVAFICCVLNSLER